MDEREFIHEIAAAWEILKKDLAIGRSFISSTPIRIDDIFQRVALSEESTYEQIFRTGLNRSSYNILLYDYAYFQFGYTADNDWRLGYFPNPWLSGAPAAELTLKHWETLEELGALTYDEASDLISEMPYVGAVPPVRFEFSAAQYREFSHPAAHFHIGRHTANRWPSAVSLGPKAFALLIAKLYYPQAWSKLSSFSGAPGAACIENVLLTVIANTRAVSDFSNLERQSFHFGKNMVQLAASTPRENSQG